MAYYYNIYEQDDKTCIVIKKSKDMISSISKLGKLAVCTSSTLVNGNDHNVCLPCDKVLNKSVNYCDSCGDAVTVVKP